MQVYKAPVRDMQFVIHELHDSASTSFSRSLAGLEEVTPELIDSILEEAAKFAESVLLPINASGDEEGCTYENGVVRTPKGIQGGLRRSSAPAAGRRIGADPAFGGQGLPEVVNKQIEEMISATNPPLGCIQA